MRDSYCVGEARGVWKSGLAITFTLWKISAMELSETCMPAAFVSTGTQRMKKAILPHVISSGTGMPAARLMGIEITKDGIKVQVRWRGLAKKWEYNRKISRNVYEDVPQNIQCVNLTKKTFQRLSLNEPKRPSGFLEKGECSVAPRSPKALRFSSGLTRNQVAIDIIICRSPGFPLFRPFRRRIRLNRGIAHFTHTTLAPAHMGAE